MKIYIKQDLHCATSHHDVNTNTGICLFANCICIIVIGYSLS